MAEGEREGERIMSSINQNVSSSMEACDIHGAITRYSATWMEGRDSWAETQHGVCTRVL